MEDRSANPRCKFCGRPMQFNASVSTPTLKQYLCGCRGDVYYLNVPFWTAPLELRKKKAK